MKILLFFLLIIYEISGQLFGVSLPKFPISVPVPIPIGSTIKTTDDKIAPGARYASSIQDLINLGFNVKDYDNSTLEDSFLLAPQLISKYGYPSENHTVVTADQYILEMHRIPGSPHAKNNGQRKQPIFLMHGAFDSSSTWVIMRPNHGLGYLLADMGYDVWLGNARGNRYARKHISLNPDGSSGERSKYWDFTWHETGVFDLPAMIDYILDTTGFKKLHYIGHAQGGVVGLVLTSELRQYNDKLMSMQLLATAGSTSRVKGALGQIAALLQGPSTSVLRDLLGMYELLPSHDLLTMVARIVCTESLRLAPLVCTNIIFLLTGFNPEQLNQKMLPIIAGHTPAGVASKNVFHFLQLVNSGRFCQYDHGSQKNLAIYGQSTPPDYNLNNIRTPVAMYYADNDMVIADEDILETSSKLPTLIEAYRVKDPKFSHIDYIWGIDVVDLVYKRLFTNLEVAEQMQTKLN